MTCAINPKYIGLVYTVFGVCASLSSIGVGPVVKLIGRSLTLLVGACINSALLIFMLVWQPTEDQLPLLCVVAGLWGVCEAIWLTQISVLYGLLFPNDTEAGFSTDLAWDAIGMMVIYLMVPRVRTDVGILVLLVMLLLTMCGYAVIQYRERKSKQDGIDQTRM